MESREAAVLLTLAKYHTAQTGVAVLLVLCLGLVPQVVSAVIYIWWFCILGIPLFFVPILLTIFASAGIVNHETRLYVVYLVGQVLLVSVLSAWLGRFLLVLSSLTFTGLLAQTTYYEVAGKRVRLQTALALPVGSELLIWLSSEVALVPAASIRGVLILTGALLCSLVYMVIFTLGSFHRACSGGNSDALGLWKSYAAVCSWARRMNLN